MAKFEKFNPEKHLRGLAEAARRIQIEELTRDQDISFPYAPWIDALRAFFVLSLLGAIEAS